MPVFTKDDKKVLFRHIPKTAGSSIENSFVASGWQMSFFRKQTSLPCCPQHYHDVLLDKFAVTKETYDIDFAVVRNPWFRLCSEYFHQYPGNKYLLKSMTKFFQYLERFFISAVKTYDRQEDQFEANPDTFCSSQRFLYDNHIRPQYHYVSNTTKVFTFEKLDVMWETLQDIYDLQPLQKSRTRGSAKGKYPDRYCGVDDRFIDAYYKTYGKDHTQFGYPMPF